MDERSDQKTVSDSGSLKNAKATSSGRASLIATDSGQSSPSTKTEIELGPDEEKLLTVLHIRVRDAASDNPILKDQHASELLDRIDHGASKKSFKLDQKYIQYLCGRSKQMDQWTQDFLDQHSFEDILVLQIGCGLDTRCLRVTTRKDVKWIDVDKPRVTDLRERLISPPEGCDYGLVSAMVADDDDSWLKQLPADRPTLIIMEGVTYYMDPDKGVRLFKRLLDHFSHGNIVFDTLGSLGVTFTSLISPVKKFDARCKWGIDDASEITKLDSRLVLRDRVFTHDLMEAGPFAKNYPPLFGGLTPLISLLPNFKKNGQFLHFEF